MNNIKIIQNEQEHQQALERLMELMDADPVSGSSDADDLDLLALLIEHYEQKNHPIQLPTPIEAIKFRMEQQGLLRKDLIPFLGSASRVTEVLNGTRKLSIKMIRKLNKGLGISADVLIQEPIQEKAMENELDPNLFPLSEMKKRGYFEGVIATLPELKEYAAEHITRLLESVPGGMSLEPAMLRTSAHLNDNNKEANPFAIWAWQVRVLQKAQEELLTLNYKSGTVDLDWMVKLAQLSWSAQGPNLAKEYLNSHGIHLIFEEHLPKTYLDGAVCRSSNGNPVIALTLRHNRLDNFWFTLMHELAHIALHFDETEKWFIDDLDAERCDIKEQEADALAEEALQLKNESVINCNANTEEINLVAKKLSISPCIIAGSFRFQSKNHKMFGRAFRDKISGLVQS